MVQVSGASWPRPAGLPPPSGHDLHPETDRAHRRVVPEPIQVRVREVLGPERRRAGTLKEPMAEAVALGAAHLAAVVDVVADGVQSLPRPDGVRSESPQEGLAAGRHIWCSERLLKLTNIYLASWTES